eukprot:12246858-Alexandrium_andersonii.AAC.1
MKHFAFKRWRGEFIDKGGQEHEHDLDMSSFDFARHLCVTVGLMTQSQEREAIECGTPLFLFPTPLSESSMHTRQFLGCIGRGSPQEMRAPIREQPVE